MLKYFFLTTRQYILIFLTATIFFFNLSKNVIAKEDSFFIKNLEASHDLGVNFSRDKVIEDTLQKALKSLLSKVLLSKNLVNLKKISFKDTQKLVESFQITNERFEKNKYYATFNVFFNSRKLGIFLSNQNLPFSNPKDISVLLFPIYYSNNDIKLFDENIFYKNWKNSNFKNKLINFILPFEDLDELLLVNKNKGTIENFEINQIAKKYNTSNYIIVIMEQQNDILKTFLKMNLSETKYSKNENYNFPSNEDLKNTFLIIDDLKLKILDTWKEANIVNFALPLFINLYLEDMNLNDLNELEKTINNISIIHHYSLEEFSINKSIIKIKYYGDPKKLYKEFSKFNYKLQNNKGYWVLNKK